MCFEFTDGICSIGMRDIIVHLARDNADKLFGILDANGVTLEEVFVEFLETCFGSDVSSSEDFLRSSYVVLFYELVKKCRI